MREFMDLVITKQTNDKLDSLHDTEQRIKNHILPYFGAETKLIRVNVAKIEAFKTHMLSKRYSSATTNHCLVICGLRIALPFSNN